MASDVPAEEPTDDLEYEVTEESPEEESLSAPQYEIFSYPADTTLKGYLEQWNNDQLEIPPFQRDYVWDQTRASKLIESFLLGLPVPPVFLYKSAGRKAFWIIDGNQRIHSIVYFQKGFFGEQKFRLKGVDPRWLGKTFEDLTGEEKFHLQTAVLRAIVIQQTNPEDHSSVYHIFERLNTGGIRLNPMEVRQCVYAGGFIVTLKEKNKLEAWRKIIGIDNPDKRLKDVELLLRVIALFRSLKSYEKPMKGFLNQCAIDFKIREEGKDRAAAKEEADKIFERFEDTCNAILEQLGPKPFHLRGRLNYSALDAVMVAVMTNGNKDDLKDKFEALTKNDEFLKAVSFNTSDESVVRTRINLALSHLA